MDKISSLAAALLLEATGALKVKVRKRGGRCLTYLMPGDVARTPIRIVVDEDDNIDMKVLEVHLAQLDNCSFSHTIH